MMEASFKCKHCFEYINDEVDSSILCHQCDCWVHLKCTKYTEKDDLDSIDFLCQECDESTEKNIGPPENDNEHIQIINPPKSNKKGKMKKKQSKKENNIRPPDSVDANIQNANPPISNKKVKVKSNQNDDDREAKLKKLADKKEETNKAFTKYIKSSEIQSGFQLYKCQNETCDFETLSNNDAKKHALGHDKKIIKKKKKEKKKHHCVKCNETFLKRKDFKVHWSQLHAPNECSLCTLCGKEFKDSVNLSQHLQTVHVKNTVVSCTVCTKVFKNNFSMQTHVNSVHRERNICCDECGKTFTTKRSLRLHFKKVHDSRSFECDCGCNKKFISKAYLERHQNSKRSLQRRSNNDEVTNCPYCDKTFFWKSNLSRHVRLSHLSDERFLCELCCATFKTKYSLQRHTSIIHKDKDSNVNMDMDLDTDHEIVSHNSHIKTSRKPDTTEWKFVTSCLGKSTSSLVSSWIASLGCKGMGSAIDDDITHVIVGTDSRMNAERSLKYLQGIATGKLMVSHLWVEEAVNCGFIPDTKNFEVKDGENGGGCGPQNSRIDKENGNIGLLSRFEILMLGEFEDLSKGDMENLLHRAGAKCVADKDSFSPHPHVNKIIIRDSIATMEVDDVVTNLRDHQLATVEKDWLLDSFGDWLLRPLLPYMIGQVTEEHLKCAGYCCDFPNVNSDPNVTDDNNCEIDSNDFNDNVNIDDYIRLDDYDNEIEIEDFVCNIIESVINNVVFNSKEKQQEQWGFNQNSFENFLLLNLKDVPQEEIQNYLIKCKVCDNVFTSKANLLNHMKVNHVDHGKEYYKYPCDVCGKKFTRKSYLEDHKQSLHSESDELFECKKCSSVFISKYLLYQHFPCVLKCRYCDQEFRCKPSLEKHALVFHAFVSRCN